MHHTVTHFLGMLTSWNKLCFNTGYIEISASLPGSSSVPGLWPGMSLFKCQGSTVYLAALAAWTLGNLVCIFDPMYRNIR